MRVTRAFAALPIAAQRLLVDAHRAARPGHPAYRAALDAVRDVLARLVIGVDTALGVELRAILGHPQLRRLEASWRGLHHLCTVRAGLEGSKRVDLRVLTLSWPELARDLDVSGDMDRSAVFSKVFNELDMPGGYPYGLLVVDFDFGPGIKEIDLLSDHGVPTRKAYVALSDLEVLGTLATIGALSFAPIVASAAPSLLGCDSWREVAELRAVPSASTAELVKLRSLRDGLDARFVALTLPRILMRRPHRDAESRLRFRFDEGAGAAGGAAAAADSMVWGSAAYAFAAVVMRAFDRDGWFADIRSSALGPDGLRDGGGITPAPAVDEYRSRVARSADEAAADDLAFFRIGHKPATEVVFDEEAEQDLLELGFLPVSRCKHTRFIAFHGAASLNNPRSTTDPLGAANARLSAMLSHTLCACRFAHYIRRIARDKIGKSMSAEELARMLDGWLHQWVNDDAAASIESLGRRPLADAHVTVRETRPGAFVCTIDLKPLHQFDRLAGVVNLRTELATTAAN